MESTHNLAKTPLNAAQAPLAKARPIQVVAPILEVDSGCVVVSTSRRGVNSSTASLMLLPAFRGTRPFICDEVDVETALVTDDAGALEGCSRLVAALSAAGPAARRWREPDGIVASWILVGGLSGVCQEFGGREWCRLWNHTPRHLGESCERPWQADDTRTNQLNR